MNIKKSKTKRNYELMLSSQKSMDKALGVSREVRKNVRNGHKRTIDDNQNKPTNASSPTKVSALAVNTSKSNLFQDDEPDLSASESFSRLDSNLYRSSAMRSLLGVMSENINASMLTVNNRASLESLRASNQTLREQPIPQRPVNTSAQQINALSRSVELHVESSATLLYNEHFSGLEAFGTSGMTVLEELIDLALKTCEKGRIAGQKHHSRGAALLGPEGQVYTGCDVYAHEGDPTGVSAERAAVLAAVAAGTGREFLSHFAPLPIILVNCNIECRHTSIQELFPLGSAVVVQPSKAQLDSLVQSFDGAAAPGATKGSKGQSALKSLPMGLSSRVERWSPADVQLWLKEQGLGNLS
eukprot:gene10693-22327_t